MVGDGGPQKNLYRQTWRFQMEVKVGDKIRILHMDGEMNYDGAEGVVRRIDDMGQLHGTWGGLAVIPDLDSFEVIE